MPKGFHSNHVRGSKHYRWSGGRCISSHGYVKVRIPGHSHADPNGYVYGHLLAWLEAGNQPPAHDEVIHHVNGDKQDNRIENLRIEKRCHHSVGHHRSVSDAAVRMIRELYASRTLDMPALAKKFGVPAVVRSGTCSPGGRLIRPGCSRLMIRSGHKTMPRSPTSSASARS